MSLETETRSRREEELARYLRLEYGSPEAGWFLEGMRRDRSESRTSLLRYWIQRLQSGLSRMTSILKRTPVTLEPTPPPVVVYKAAAASEGPSGALVLCSEGIRCDA